MLEVEQQLALDAAQIHGFLGNLARDIKVRKAENESARDLGNSSDCPLLFGKTLQPHCPAALSARMHRHRREKKRGTAGNRLKACLWFWVGELCIYLHLPRRCRAEVFPPLHSNPHSPKLLLDSISRLCSLLDRNLLSTGRFCYLHWLPKNVQTLAVCRFTLPPSPSFLLRATLTSLHRRTEPHGLGTSYLSG